MINDILAWGGMPGGWEWVVILVVFGVPILLIVLFVRLVLRNRSKSARKRKVLKKAIPRKNQDDIFFAIAIRSLLWRSFSILISVKALLSSSSSLTAWPWA